MLQPIMMIAGPVMWFITKNKRWMVVTLVGIVWFVADVLLVAVTLI